ncbi:hypothetical protein PPTG_20732 [Phytophthora nicotianae INRA-310]|uniref:Uncharacterized protein n=1 Tax=Phytophthora nicotianae (strain INRA-310) TaxID=761204 RepID=W2RH21_PHYN3|nr:hypothetical protein PPTG_20732 [Phytophthora nicotianae INRA-310]ETN23944.1 hypothetical protein PPTG_20732 [Phytophthora nicotianae INRA-310]
MDMCRKRDDDRFKMCECRQVTARDQARALLMSSVMMPSSEDTNGGVEGLPLCLSAEGSCLHAD